MERSTRLAEAQLWDTFDATATLVSRVRLPLHRHLGGVGTKSLYLIATDDDGVQRLERYRREWSFEDPTDSNGSGHGVNTRDVTYWPKRPLRRSRRISVLAFSAAFRVRRKHSRA